MLLQASVNHTVHGEGGWMAIPYPMSFHVRGISGPRSLPGSGLVQGGKGYAPPEHRQEWELCLGGGIHPSR